MRRNKHVRKCEETNTFLKKETNTFLKKHVLKCEETNTFENAKKQTLSKMRRNKHAPEERNKHVPEAVSYTNLRAQETKSKRVYQLLHVI